MYRGSIRPAPLVPRAPAPMPHLPRAHYQPWTATEDAALCEAIAGGATFAQAAPLVGRGRCACLGRWRRITRA